MTETDATGQTDATPPANDHGTRFNGSSITIFAGDGPVGPALATRLSSTCEVRLVRLVYPESGIDPGKLESANPYSFKSMLRRVDAHAVFTDVFLEPPGPRTLRMSRLGVDALCRSYVKNDYHHQGMLRSIDECMRTARIKVWAPWELEPAFALAPGLHCGRAPSDELIERARSLMPMLAGKPHSRWITTAAFRRNGPCVMAHGGKPLGDLTAALPPKLVKAGCYLLRTQIHNAPDGVGSPYLSTECLAASVRAGVQGIFVNSKSVVILPDAVNGDFGARFIYAI